MSESNDGIIMVPASGQAPSDQGDQLQTQSFIVGDQAPEKKEKPEAEKEAEKPAEKSDADKVQEVRDLLKFGKKKEAPKKPEPEPEAEAEDEPPTKPAKKAAKKAEPAAETEPSEDAEPEAPRRRPRFHTEDLEKVAEATARTVLSAKAEESAKATKTEAEVDETALDDRDAELLAVYRELEAANPKFKGQSNKFLKFVPAAKTYEATWRRRHPGEDFNPDDAEHAEFYAKYEPLPISESDEAVAKKQLTKRATRQEVDSVLAEKEREIEKRVEWRFKRREQIPQEASTAVAEFVELVDPDVAKKVSTISTKEELEAFAEEDPATFEVLEEYASQTRRFVSSLVEAERPDGGVDLDLRNPAHRHLASILSSREDYVTSLPKSKQLHEGRQFATQEEYSRMSDKEKDRHWIIDAYLLKRELLKEISSVAKEQLKRERKKFERYRGKGSASTQSPREEEPEVEKPKPAAPKTRSPETRASVGSVNSDGTKTAAPNAEKQAVKDLLWG